jgi:hypothetical protein
MDRFFVRTVNDGNALFNLYLPARNIYLDLSKYKIYYYEKRNCILLMNCPEINEKVSFRKIKESTVIKIKRKYINKILGKNKNKVMVKIESKHGVIIIKGTDKTDKELKEWLKIKKKGNF